MGQRTKTLLVLHCLQVELKGVRISNDVEFVVFTLHGLSYTCTDY